MTEKTTNKSKKDNKSIAYYDDEHHDYEDFWVGRDYEHESEVLALNKLLSNRHFDLAMDYGGGYGRISPVLLEYVDKLILVDPSTKQLNIAKERLAKYKNVEYVKVDKENSVPAEDNSLDLLVMIRVSHHLAEPGPTFKEISRTLKPGGMAIIEIANEAHFLNRMKYLSQLKGVPKTSVPIGQKANGITDNTPFYNHNPNYIAQLMALNRLLIVDKLSVSNLRSSYLKSHLKLQSMLKVEKTVQPILAPLNFGPSMFFLVKKED